MPITDWPLQERPRERLLKLGPQALSDTELLAIFLRTGTRGKTALDLARDLLTFFNGSLRKLVEASKEELCQHRGLGVAKYVQLQASLELSRRHLYEDLPKKKNLWTSQQTKNFLLSQMRHHKREVFACLFLDNRNHILSFEELFYGTLDSASVHPREVVKRALQVNAAAVILCHNHPSGVSEPSPDDKYLTERLVKALAMVGVRVLDHMVVGDGQVTSFIESGLLK